MASRDLHVVVLAAGDSTRIRTGEPKALLDLCGRPLLEHVLRAAEGVGAASHTVVLGGRHREAVTSWLREAGLDWRVAVQQEARGTGDAVRAGIEALPAEGRVMVLCGDTPLLESETLAALAAEGESILTARVPDPRGYGRVLRDEDGALTGIVEEADADEAERELDEVNAGVYVLDLARLRRALDGMRADNAQGELYLTGAAVETLAEGGGASVCLEGDPDQILGVNDLADFAAAVAAMRERIVAAHMLAGVQMDDPGSAFVECDVEIAPGARIMPFCVLRRGVRVGPGCVVGPFAHLRPGTVLAAGAEVGNFVETKNAELGEGAKAKHLTYLGDAEVGAGANVGCGTITANYDGHAKHRTVIGPRAFVGSGTVLVAPVRVGAEARTGAGAVVPAGRDVPDGETVVGVPARPHPSRKPGSQA